ITYATVFTIGSRLSPKTVSKNVSIVAALRQAGSPRSPSSVMPESVRGMATGGGMGGASGGGAGCCCADAASGNAAASAHTATDLIGLLVVGPGTLTTLT